MSVQSLLDYYMGLDCINHCLMPSDVLYTATPKPNTAYHLLYFLATKTNMILWVRMRTED